MQNRFIPRNAITDTEILALQPKAQSYKVFIGNGAYLLITPDGGKYWRLKYRLNAKENTYSLGVFPKVSIESAKVARAEAKALIRQGINPSVAKREAKAKATAAQDVTRTVFRLGLSKSGGLTIETQTNALTLTSLQTLALTAFLASYDANRKEAQEWR